MISSCCKKFFNFIKIFYKKCLKNTNKIQKYSQITQNINNEENKPAKILSSEEINQMINDQIKFNKEQSNTNGYKIIKQKNLDEPKTGELLNIEEIKNEINQIEFEEEENKNKKEKNDDNGMVIDNNEEEKNNEDNIENLDNDEEYNANINIEELRKDVLESNEDE